MKRILQALGQLALLAVALAIAPAAQAAFQTTYTFDVDYCTSGCLFGGTGGTVTLTQNGAGDVTVTVSLTGVDFHDQGLTSFVWNLDDAVTGVSIQNLAGDGGGTWSALQTSVHEDGAGTFDYAVNCSNCGPQNGGVEIASISFDVLGTGLTTDSFHFLSSGGSPSAYFAAAVFNTTDTTCTGVIGADGGTTPRTGGSNDGSGDCATPVQEMPEPHGLALAGLGLLAVGFIRRRNAR
jgi:MYXO-CTERM domain-containing protein